MPSSVTGQDQRRTCWGSGFGNKNLSEIRMPFTFLIKINSHYDEQKINP